MFILEHFLANLTKITIANQWDNSQNWRALGPFPQKTGPAPPVANQRRNTTKSTRVKLPQLPQLQINLTENYWKTEAGKTVLAPPVAN